MPVCTLESLDRRVELGDPSTGPAQTQADTNRHFIDITFKTCVRWKIFIQGDSSAQEFMSAMHARMAPRPDTLHDAVTAFHYRLPFEIEQDGT